MMKYLLVIIISGNMMWEERPGHDPYPVFDTLEDCEKAANLTIDLAQKEGDVDAMCFELVDGKKGTWRSGYSIGCTRSQGFVPKAGGGCQFAAP